MGPALFSSTRPCTCRGRIGRPGGCISWQGAGPGLPQQEGQPPTTDTYCRCTYMRRQSTAGAEQTAIVMATKRGNHPPTSPGLSAAMEVEMKPPMLFPAITTRLPTTCSTKSLSREEGQEGQVGLEVRQVAIGR